MAVHAFIVSSFQSDNWDGSVKDNIFNNTCIDTEQLPKLSVRWLGFRKCFWQYMHILVFMSCNDLICMLKFDLLLNFVAHNSQGSGFGRRNCDAQK